MSDLDVALGEELKEEGMTLASEAQERDDDRWEGHALNMIRTVARGSEYFDADDLRAWGVAEPEHHAAWGSVWQKAMKFGWIEETLDQPRRRSIRGKAHASKMTRYKSRIWEGF